MRRTNAARGFSLLEIILATAIFVAGVAVTGQLFSLSLKASRSARMRSIAVLHAESQLALAAAGLIPLAGSLDEQAIPFTDDPSWQWRLAVEPTPIEGLVRVTVMVQHRRGGGGARQFTDSVGGSSAGVQAGTAPTGPASPGGLAGTVSDPNVDYEFTLTRLLVQPTYTMEPALDDDLGPRQPVRLEQLLGLPE